LILGVSNKNHAKRPSYLLELLLTNNTVCLPEKDILNDKPEEVEFSGWGKTANIKGYYS
jgi:hypothetical protein